MTPAEAMKWAINAASLPGLDDVQDALRVAAAAVARDAADRGPRAGLAVVYDEIASWAGESLRRIANEKLERGSREWAEAHRISGYIEGLEEGRDLMKRFVDGAPRSVPPDAWHKRQGYETGRVTSTRPLVRSPDSVPRHPTGMGPDLSRGPSAALWFDDRDGLPSFADGQRPHLPTDAELLARSAERGVQELGAAAWDAFREVFRGGESLAADTSWKDLRPDSRNAWRRAAQQIWKMAR